LSNTDSKFVYEKETVTYLEITGLLNFIYCILRQMLPS